VQESAEPTQRLINQTLSHPTSDKSDRMSHTLQRSQTHRLVFFEHSTPSSQNGYLAVENAVADEVEDLRAFVTFLYPPGGQDRFRLLRPDTLELRWTVYDQTNHRTYAQAMMAREAVRAARHRLAAESRQSSDLELQPSTD